MAGTEVVPRQALIDALWDERPPATAHRQLLNCASSIRRRLAEAGLPASMLWTDPVGYRLRVAPGELDAQVFAAQVASAQERAGQGRTGEAVRLLRTALGLWQGPALVDVGGQALQAAAVRLDEQRLLAVELCLELELRQGRHVEVIAELAELVATQPLRERLAGQLMLALHRAGRRADALAAYQRLRTRLAGELGLSPGAALRELHTAILRDADVPPAPAVVPPIRADGAPRQLPAAVRHFVGRDAELKELRRLLDEDADAGTVVISAIDGTAGIGKTALALLFAHQAAPRFPDGQLYVNLRGYHPTGTPVAPGEAIRGFLGALQAPAERIPASLDGQTALYRALLAGRRVLVVLDNARDADQVRPLLPASPTCLIIVTSRHQLTGLAAGESASALTLDLFTAAEARDLLVRHLGPARVDAEPAAVDRLIVHCVRLPLALAIVAARAAAHPAFPLTAFADELAGTGHRLDALDAGDPTTRVRTVFSWSYRRLSAPAARLFRLLGLHPGPDTGVAAAASLAGVPVPQVRPLLAELTRAHLVVEHAPGRYTLHDLLRAYAAELAAGSDDHHVATHRMLDHYLRTACAAERQIYPHARPLPLPACQPGVTVEEIADHDHALAWFDAERPVLLGAVGQATDPAFDVHVWQLAWSLGHYVQIRKNWRDWATALGIALVSAERLGNQEWLAQVHRALGYSYVQLDRLDLATFHGGQALELARLAGDHAGQAQAALTLAEIWDRRDDPAAALDQARQALALYQQAEHEGGQAIALNAVGWCLVRLEDYEQAVACCRQALAVQQRLGNLQGQAETWDSLGMAYHHLGAHPEAIESYRRSVELFQGLGDRHLAALTLDHLADTQLAGGDPGAARDTWQESLAILADSGDTGAAAEAIRAKLRAGTGSR